MSERQAGEDQVSPQQAQSLHELWHRKRSAYEPARAFVGAEAPSAAPLKRPLATSLGAGFVIARVLFGVLWLLVFAVEWNQNIAPEFDLSPDESRLALSIVLIGGGIGELLLLVLGVMIWRGSNLARVLVMCGLTLSILTAASGYFAYGEQITLTTTLFTLSMDILVLLALSSRDARMWSRYRIAARKSTRRAARA